MGLSGHMSKCGDNGLGLESTFTKKQSLICDSLEVVDGSEKKYVMWLSGHMLELGDNLLSLHVHLVLDTFQRNKS